MKSRKILLLILIIVLYPVLTQAADPKEIRDKWAVLVGVEDYQHVVKLSYCGTDVRDLQKVLVKTGFPERQISLLTDQSTDKKLLPFKANIQQQIERVAGYAEPGDLLLIALSGHGINHDGKNYFCPVETQIGQTDSMVDLQWVYDQLEKSKADLKVVLIDACRNDPRPAGKKALPAEEYRASANAFVTTSQRVPKGVMLIHSCSAGELSQEDPDLKHSVFMNFVLQGLVGKADDNNDKAVTLYELTKYATKETKLFVEQHYNDSQRPSVKGEFEVDVNEFPIAKLGLDTSGAELGTSGGRPRVPIAPFSGAEARAAQKLWSEVLGRQELTDKNSIGMDLVLVPPGQFMMGSPASASVRSSDETQVNVKLTEPFWIGSTEVTQREWQSVMKTAPWVGTFNGKEDVQCAATQINWHDANEFCRKLGQIEGCKYRLPTEAEWEWSCRAGTSSRYCFGDDDRSLRDYAWYMSESSEYHINRVGLKRPNAFGIYDMHGNADEWCLDEFARKLPGGTNPLVERGDSAPIHVVSRGSSGSIGRSRTGDLDLTRFTSAGRGIATPGQKSVLGGFRVVRVP